LLKFHPSRFPPEVSKHDFKGCPTDFIAVTNRSHTPLFPVWEHHRAIVDASISARLQTASPASLNFFSGSDKVSSLIKLAALGQRADT
jgi:hypothetical protein